ncbi:PREDICTED: protein fem-1 homolog A-like [Priapulus caudatus]|uniref:Protein fem-1 homolog A-like n=1 Tax=Priapulus caudatus TaxID=37621 RepID=A0ABM1EUH8_PRICU|nr:PREDICTED: protein fem-1 homolog A-like [Priapulus caudatus]
MDNDSCSEILKRSIKLGDVVETRKYLDHNKLTEREKNTVLHLLLEGSSSNGQTPRVESFNPRVQITYMLCACGANVDQLNQDDHTPLQVAAHHGMNHPCEALLQCGADMYVSFKEEAGSIVVGVRMS